MTETLAITVATLISMICAFSKIRTHILLYSLTCGLCYLFYWISSGEMTAAYMTGASMVGSLVQMIVPERHLAKTLFPRILFIGALAVFGFCISYHDMNDVLPLAGFAVARLSEVFSRPNAIRLGYMGATGFWFAFAVMSADVHAIIGNIACLVAQVWGQSSAFFAKFSRAKQIA